MKLDGFLWYSKYAVYNDQEAVLNNKGEITENNDRVLITCLIVK